jgi:hypothetical protein
MPHSAWHNKGLAGLQRKTAFASFLVENYVNCALDEIEKFVAVGMHFPGMRRIPGHSGLACESALDTGMSATALSDRLDRSRRCEPNRALRQVYRVLERLRDRLAFHAACSCTADQSILRPSRPVVKFSLVLQFREKEVIEYHSRKMPCKPAPENE